LGIDRVTVAAPLDSVVSNPFSLAIAFATACSLPEFPDVYSSSAASAAASAAACAIRFWRNRFATSSPNARNPNSKIPRNKAMNDVACPS